MSETKKQKTKKIKYSMGKEETVASQQSNLESLTKSISSNLSHNKPEDLNKSVKPLTIKKELEGRSDKNKVAFSSRDLYVQVDNTEQKGWKRISDLEQREISQIDPYISAIISTRSSQGFVVGQKSESRFDKGSRLAELDPLSYDDYKTDEEYAAACKQRETQQQSVLNWFLTCGTKQQALLDTAFEGTSDTTFKYCSLAEFVSAQVRNLLTFGRCATQVFRDENDAIVMFRPAPVETIQGIISGKEAPSIAHRETDGSSAEDAKDYNKLEPEERPPAWVQKIDGNVVNFYTERDMIVSYFQKQALFDLSGYPLSPIEQAIFMVFVHQQTLGYLRNQYVKGMAAKGILCLEPSSEKGLAAQLSDEDLEQLRRDFHNYITRNDNSSSIPVISGPVKVNFVQMATNPSDMQFLQLEEHIVRALCSAFQTSPQEMGYGHLSVGQGGLNQANKQEEIIKGEERGLRMVLDVIYELLNSILYENFPEAEKLYQLVYTGVGDDTRDSVIQRGMQELQTTATLSSLYAQSEKTEPVPFGGDVPLAPQFHQFVVAKMKYGEFREFFFGDEGAAKRPEYDFVIDPAMNQSYQQLRANPIQAQQQQTKLQLEQMSAQTETMLDQNEMAKQQMQMQQQQGPAGAQEQGPAPGQESAQKPESAQESAQSEPEAPAEKSLKDAYNEKQALQKSTKTYFSEWISANKDL